MEAILLGFCLISLTLSSIIVAIELTRDRRRQKKRNRLKPKLPLAKNRLSLKEIPLSNNQPMPEALAIQNKAKVLDSLNQQLASLGYVSPQQQMGFINQVFKSQRTHIEEIDPNEVRHLFKVIRRYTGAHETAEANPMVPASLPRIATNI